MLAIGETLRLLAQRDQAMSEAYEALISEWTPDAPPPTLVCSAMAKALLTSQRAEQRFDAVVLGIEEALVSGDDASKDAVATGFLEVVVAMYEEGDPGAALLLASLGPLAAAYCREWMLMFGDPPFGEAQT